MANKLKRWQIFLLRQKAQYIGTVDAPDEDGAIRAAIKQLGIADAERQKRLAARPIDEEGGAIPRKKKLAFG